MKKLILLIIIIVGISSCVSKSEIVEAQQICINKTIQTKLDIKLMEGNIIENPGFFELNFNKVRGGGMYLFGKYRLNKSDDDASRLLIMRGDTLLAKYSINEIKKMKFHVIADSIKVFEIPELN